MKHWHWYMIGFTVFTALVVALLVLSIPEDAPLHREEAGFMAGHKPWAKNRFPLSVASEAYTSEGHVDSSADERAVIESVVSTVNRRLGFEALNLDDRVLPTRISIQLNVPAEDGWMDPGGDAHLGAGHNFTLHCQIRTSNTGTLEMLHLVLYHEIGHCLGLDHDDFEQSIMRPEQTPTPDRTIPPWISDYDRRLIRERYAP